MPPVSIIFGAPKSYDEDLADLFLALRVLSRSEKMKIPPLAGVLLAGAAAPWCVCAGEQINVAVVNRAGVPRSIIAPAIETARSAFLAVRIESVWVICEPETCRHELPSGSYLELFIVPRLLAPLSGHTVTHPGGYAMRYGFPHPRGYAIYDSARMVAERTVHPLYLVLGSILIHEAGHLLGLNHEPQGVMRANLDDVDMDLIAMGRAFSPADAAKLRVALSPSSGSRAPSQPHTSANRP
jgi:Putative peptidase family